MKPTIKTTHASGYTCIKTRARTGTETDPYANTERITTRNQTKKKARETLSNDPRQVGDRGEQTI